jgi:hypothetical protein
MGRGREIVMKKTLASLIAGLVLLLSASVFAASTGTCTQTTTENYPNIGVKKIFFVCSASSSDGTIADQDLSAANLLFVSGYRLEQVTAYPTAGGTAPDAADVFILIKTTGEDLLGSIDNGTTAYAGLNLIHATLQRSTFPQKYVVGTGEHWAYYPLITSTLTLRVVNQATNSAKYTIGLSFFKP